jgi:hypothetical protein
VSRSASSSSLITCTHGDAAPRIVSQPGDNLGVNLSLGGDMVILMGEFPGLAGGDVCFRFRFSLPFFKHSCEMEKTLPNDVYENEKTRRTARDVDTHLEMLQEVFIKWRERRSSLSQFDQKILKTSRSHHQNLLVWILRCLCYR